MSSSQIGSPSYFFRSGGPWNTPDHAMQILVWTEKRVHGPTRFADTLAQPTTRNGFYRDIAVLALKNPEGETAGRKLRIAQINPKAAFVRGDKRRGFRLRGQGSRIPFATDSPATNGFLRGR